MLTLFTKLNDYIFPSEFGSKHLKTNHSKNFLDSESDAHTNGMQEKWRRQGVQCQQSTKTENSLLITWQFSSWNANGPLYFYTLFSSFSLLWAIPSVFIAFHRLHWKIDNLEGRLLSPQYPDEMEVQKKSFKTKRMWVLLPVITHLCTNVT